MTWAKLDVAWYEGESFDAAADLVPRAEALAAWAVLLAWTVGARTDGRLSRRKAIRIVEQQVEPVNANKVVDALERAGLLIPCDEYLTLAGWDELQVSRARQAEIDEAAAARQAKHREKLAGTHGAHVTRYDNALVTRDDNASDRKKDRQIDRKREETRVRATESASLVEPIVSPVIQAQASTPPAPKPETPRPTPSTLSPAAAAILTELERHPGLGSVATADLATAIEGRRIATGRPLPHVLSAIGDCAAKAVEGTQAQALRSMLVGFCDRAGTKARAPVAQSAPVERAWSVGEVRAEVTS